MKGIVVKIDDIVTSNSFDMTKLIVKIICLSKSLSLSNTELHALTYFVVNGYSKISRDNLITTKLLKNRNAVSNLVYAFRKYGLVVKTNKGEELNPEFNINTSDLDIVKVEMLIKK